MNVILFLDYSSFTDQTLTAAKKIIGSINDAHVTVFHIIDEQQFYSTTGFEVQLGETVHAESLKLKRLCISQLGESINFREEYGVPPLKATELLNGSENDLIIAGSNSRHGLGSGPLGSFATHLLRISKIPVVIIPLKSRP